MYKYIKAVKRYSGGGGAMTMAPWAAPAAAVTAINPELSNPGSPSQPIAPYPAVTSLGANQGFEANPEMLQAAVQPSLQTQNLGSAPGLADIQKQMSMSTGQTLVSHLQNMQQQPSMSQENPQVFAPRQQQLLQSDQASSFPSFMGLSTNNFIKPNATVGGK